MKRILLLLAFAPALSAQEVCPAIDFVSARVIDSYQNGIIDAPLVRRPDGNGSFSLYSHDGAPPYARKAEQPNAHDLFTGCLAMPTPAAPLPVLGRLQGEGSMDTAIYPNAGDGTAVGFWINFRGDAVTAYPLTSDYRYTSTTDYPIGERTGLNPGDFNQDGKPDLAVTGYTESDTAGFVAVLLGKGDGTFNQAVKSPTGGPYPTAGAAADYNGDGKLDIAVTQSSGLVVMLGKGDGTFQAPTSILNAQALQFVSSADWNGDQRADLAVTNYQFGSVLVFAGNGDGTFRAPVTVETKVDPIFISSGDFNKDGRRDLAIAGRLAVAVALGNGDGTFGTIRRYLLGHESATLVVADVNNDGHLDIVAGEGYDEFLVPMDDTGYMGVLFGRGDGTFVGAPVYPSGSTAEDLAVADFNADNRPDVVVAGQREALLMLRNANGDLAAPVVVSGGGAAAAGDFDGDGEMDLALGASSVENPAVQIFPGNGNGTFGSPKKFPLADRVRRFSVGDFNGDGRADLAAIYGSIYNGADPKGIQILMQAAGALTAGPLLPGTGILGDALAADLNGDGKTDLAVLDKGVFGQQDARGGLLIYVSNGDGTFQTPVTLAAGINPVSISSGDLNGDGRTDVIVPTGAPNFRDSLAIFLGRSGGLLNDAAFPSTDFGPISVAVGDYNRDGKQDLIIGHCCGDVDMTYMLGRGDGTFNAEQHFSAGPDPGKVLGADLNGDGAPDLLMLHLTFGPASGLSELINNSPRFVAVSAASGDASAPVAPESIVSAYGTNLAPGIEIAQSLPLPQVLAGTTVHLKDSAGVERNMPLYAAFPGQINFLVPPETALGRATITIGSSGGAAPQTSYLFISRVSPGLFTLNSAGLAAAQVVRANGNQTTTEDVYQIVDNRIVSKPITFSSTREQAVLVLYATGIRGRSALNDVRVNIDGFQSTPVYAGAQPGFEGLDQINVALNPNFLQGRGVVELTVSVEGRMSNTVTLEFP